MIVTVIRFLSFALVLTGMTLAALPARAEVMITDEVRPFPGRVNFNLVGGEWGNAKLFEASSVPASLSTTLSFQEHQGYYGFSALICDSKNAALYLESKPATCSRHEINSSKDKITFQSDGRSAYYVLILNRTQPLAVPRHITVNYITSVKWSQEVKDDIKKQIESALAVIQRRHGIPPYNVALIPCQNGYIPSAEGTLTLCSELVMNAQMDMETNLALTFLFYEAAPFYEVALRLPSVSGNETKRFEYALTMMLTLTNDEEALQIVYDWNVQHQERLERFQSIMRRGNPKFSSDAHVAAIQDFFADSTKKMNEWLEIVYASMNSETLTNIQDMKETHFSSSRNIARSVLNDRIDNAEFERIENNVTPEASGRQKLLDLADEIF